MSETLITIGKILKPFGLRGEVKVALLTDFAERFDDLKEVFVQSSQDSEPLRFIVSGVRHAPPFVFLSFEGISDVDQVETLRGAYLRVSQAERVVLPGGYYFHSDLIGMSVYTLEGLVLGEVSDILETGSNDIFIVTGERGECLIPAVSKFVKEIDLEEKRMLIEPVEGLLDL